MKTIARVLFVENENSINIYQLGLHWTSDETTLANIKSSLVGNSKGRKLIMFTEVEDSMIDFECTEISNTNFPHEKEIVLNTNTELNYVDIYDPSDDEIIKTINGNTGTNCNEWINKIHRGENIY